jgi:hypothetical protein
MVLRATQVGIVVDLASLGLRVASVGFSNAVEPALVYCMLEFLLLVMLFVLRPQWNALQVVSILGIILMTGIEFFWALYYLTFEFFGTIETFSIFLILSIIRLLALAKFGFRSLRAMQTANQ